MTQELQDSLGAIQHREFQDWRRHNPRGTFLSLESRGLANLHGAQCQHLGATSWRCDLDGRHSLTRKLKVLGVGGRGLQAWATLHAVRIHAGRHCLRDGLITEPIVRAVSRAPLRVVALEAVEGLAQEVVVLSRARSGALRKAALARAKGTCEACEVRFGSVLGGRGVRVLQVHHRQQLAMNDVPRVTKVKDLAVVCANCHALLHMQPKRALTVEKLRSLLAADSGRTRTKRRSGRNPRAR